VTIAGNYLAHMAEPVILMARWQTPEEFTAATQSPGFRQAAAGRAGYQPHPALYHVVRS
jgi:hypothetical protein